MSIRKSAVRGALFLALGVGGICFFVSVLILLWVGIVTGHVQLDLFPFVPGTKRLVGWWETGTLLVSFGLSALASKVVFRSCKKHILPGRPHF
jgi:hypothetical protein